MLPAWEATELRSGSFYTSKLNYLGSLAYRTLCKGAKYPSRGNTSSTRLNRLPFSHHLYSAILSLLFVRKGKFNWNEERVECKCSNTSDTHSDPNALLSVDIIDT